MKLNKKSAVIVQAALQTWSETGLLDKNTGAKLNSSIEVMPFDWRRLAKYSVWIALICFFIALGSLLADQLIMQLIQQYFNAPTAVKLLFFTALAITFIYYGMLRKAQHPQKVYTNEAFLVMGVAATATAIYYLGQTFKLQPDDQRHLLLLGCLVYGAIGAYFKANLIWVFALLSLGSWYGAETGYMSGWGAYYIGMNYPLRFVLFGGVLTAIGLEIEHNVTDKSLAVSTLTMGLLYLFIALWILSIFGDYGDMSSWSSVRQYQLLPWSLLFGLVALAAIVHGLRYDNALTKGFGVTFLFINLYTRFFEYFWDSLHKALFFVILAVSFWYLGTRAEKIWYLGSKSKS